MIQGASKDANGQHVRILISDIQSGYGGFGLQISIPLWVTQRRSTRNGRNWTPSTADLTWSSSPTARAVR